MGKSHRAKKTEAQYQKAAALLVDGAPIKTALAQAGWSESQAAKGWEAVPKGVLKIMSKSKKGQALIALGKSTPREDKEALVNGRLIRNCIQGTDKAAQSAKILGSSRELNMWTPDSQTGVIVLQCPQSLVDRKAELLAGLPDEGN